MQYFDDVEMSAATTLPMPVIPETAGAVKPGAPSRLPTDPMVYYAVDGLLLGLKDLDEKRVPPVEGFSEKLRAAMPEDLRRKLRDPGYKLPDDLWEFMYELPEAFHTELQYRIVWHVHLCEALYLVRIITPEDGDPLETLAEREHLALPLELAGPACFKERMEAVKSLFPRFRIDKGRMEDFNGYVDYPALRKYFFSRRAKFFRLCNLEEYDGMMVFLKDPGRAMAKVPSLPHWPKDLSLFYTETAIMDAIRQVSSHYFFRT